MGKHRILFIWSGISALVFYCIAIVLLLRFFSIFTTRYAPQVDTMMGQTVDIDIAIMEMSKENKQDSGTHIEGGGIRDIFSIIPSTKSFAQESGDNRSRKAKNTKDKIDSSRLQTIQEKLKELNSNFDLMDHKTLDIQSQRTSPNFTEGEHDKWFGKIYDIIYSKWQSKYYPDAEVSVLLRVASVGDFSYRIITFSQYENYNQSVVDLLESLKQERLPPYPDGRSIEIKVNFRLK